MNLSIALSADALPDDEQPAPEKHPWRGNMGPLPKRAKLHRNNDFAYIYQHDKAFRPDWADQKPGSTPQLPLKPPSGRP